MKLWEILKLIEEHKIEKGEKFRTLGLHFVVEIEYDGSDLVYVESKELVGLESLIMGLKFFRTTEITCNLGKVVADLVRSEL